MEVINNQVTLLTNFEVLKLLNEAKKESDSLAKTQRSKNLATTVFQTTKYLNQTPAAKTQAAEISTLIKNIEPFKCTGAEVLQIINMRPTNAVELQLIVEESEERFKTEEQLESIIEMENLDVIGEPFSSPHSTGNEKSAEYDKPDVYSDGQGGTSVADVGDADQKSNVLLEDMKPPKLSPEQSQYEETIIEEQQAIDSHNTIMVSSEDLAEAGLDIDSLNNLTEDQVNSLMVIAERRTQRQEEAENTIVTDPSNETEVVAADNEPNFGEPSTANGDSITMVITDDGSLKLTDASNEQFFFSHEQLSQMNINVNNLTDESIQQIVQMAMPVINIENKQSIRQKPDETVMYEDSIGLIQPSTSSGIKQDIIRPSQLIGEQIELRKNGRPVLATIRYVRNGGSYKVQFEDGHFEWITDEQLTLRGSRRNDHEGYHNETTAAGRVIHAAGLAGCLKRGHNSAQGPVSKRLHMEPNFCCPICDNKVYQKEPAYIVIRIPACDSCTREKIIVLDDPTDDNVIQ